MKVSDAYTGTYQSVKNWPESPTSHVITGVGLEDDQFSKAKNARIIFVQLDGKEIKYRVNKTNASFLADVWGDDLNKWKGKKCTIHREQARIRGEDGWQGIITPIGSKAGKKK